MTVALPGVPEAGRLLQRVEPNLPAALKVREVITKVAAPPAELTQVSVSRLVNPGRAYYDLVAPLAEDLAAHQKRLAGSGAHDLLEEAVAAGVQFTELWLNGEDAPGEPSLERITARVDACELEKDGRYAPTEIKNVGAEKELPAEEHLEQLGMYCALMGVENGRILAVHRDDVSGASRLLVPWKVHFPDLELVRRTMAERRDLLTDAFARKDPSALPGCPWWGAKCKYREAGTCDCGSRSRLEPSIARSAQVVRDPDYLELLRKRAAEREAARSAEGAELRLTLGGFLTPRKVYFASQARPLESPGEEEGAAPAVTPGHVAQAERSLTRVNSRGMERQVFSAILRSNKGSAGFANVGTEGRSWRVPVLDGAPFLVRVRHVGRALGGGAQELAGNWGVPDDLRQLALRASLLGVAEGRVYVWNWKVPDPETKLQVYDVKFDPEALREVDAFARDLPKGLAHAVETGEHRPLPLCPRWMCDRCDFRARCAPELGQAPRFTEESPPGGPPRGI